MSTSGGASASGSRRPSNASLSYASAVLMKRMAAAKRVRRRSTIAASPSTRTSGGPSPPQPYAPKDSLVVVSPVRPSVTDGMRLSDTLGLQCEHLRVDDAVRSLAAQVGRDSIG